MAVTLESFLDNDPQVKAARRKLNAAKAQLDQQNQALASAGGRINEAQRQTIQSRINTAQGEYDKARNEASRVESERTKFFTVNQKDIQAKAVSEDVTKAQQELEEVLALKAQYPNQPSLDARVIDLNDRINQRGKYAPKKEVKEGTGVAGDPKVGTNPVDYTQLINGAVQIVRKMPVSERRQLQQDLKAAGFYKGPVVDIYTDELVAAYQLALQSNQQRNQLWGEEVPWGQFLTDKANEKAALEAGEGRTPTGTVSISTPLEAAAKVEDIFKTELGRIPTAEEVEKYSKKLIAREKKQSSITKATQRKVGGILVTEYTGGLDRDQFLQNLVRKTPEYSKRKAEGRSLTVQTLQSTANANGVTLSPQELEQYALDVQNGKDIKVVQSQIRTLAGLGMPDTVRKLLADGTDLSTIYSPYKKAMATILEINPETISLSDPVLRSAIGPNGEMSLYEYQRSLRKDPRWQYTNNAREDVSTAALQVLRDFGFQG